MASKLEHLVAGGRALACLTEFGESFLGDTAGRGPIQGVDPGRQDARRVS
ncbi:MAG: hypothetical protein M3P38_01055 [Chloroflexota bacterium]|nr:hypothetical protein [Chloroflexota bacterium]